MSSSDDIVDVMEQFQRKDSKTIKRTTPTTPIDTRLHPTFTINPNIIDQTVSAQ